MRTFNVSVVGVGVPLGKGKTIAPFPCILVSFAGGSSGGVAQALVTDVFISQ